MPQKITIAIDGFASCGKSTLAKGLAKKLHYTYIDSGAMYRAVMLYFLDHNIDINDPVALEKGLKEAKIEFRRNPKTGSNEIYLNGKNVEQDIREMRVSRTVSKLSKIKVVRERMVELQKHIGNGKGIVMDGRDIGTVVFPKAEVKIFMTADFEERVDRRHREMVAKGIDITKEEVAENLKERDHIDTNRKISPLKKAADAIEINNTEMTPEEQLQKAYSFARDKIDP